MKLILTLLAVLGLNAAPAALAQGCCGGPTCDMAAQPMSCGHGAAQAAASAQDSGQRHVFMKPVQLVFDNYIKAQRALGQDSLEGVGSTANTMAEVIRSDPMKRLSPKIAEQADALAQAKSLVAARAAFKSLSESLIGYLKEQKVSAGAYYVAYCPMAKASWIQTDKTIINPYMGKGMIHCGQIKT